MRSAVNPILSVILPVYNTEKFVAQAIESILNQTFVDFELIIADDGSKDGSCKIVNAYAEQDDRIIISHNEINQGKVKTVNRLFEMCRGKYLTIHDADDWSELARFQIQLDFLQKFDKNVLCGSNFYSHFGSKRFIASDLQTEGGKIIEDLGKHSQIHGPTAIFHSEIVKELGTLYRDFSTAEDIDFILRTSEKYLVTNIPQCLYHYRIHDNSITNNLNSFNYERLTNWDLIQTLRIQRIQRGYDDLMLNISKEQVLKENGICASTSQIYNFAVSRNLSFGFYRNAFLISLNYLRESKFSFDSMKVFIYLLVGLIKQLIYG